MIILPIGGDPSLVRRERRNVRISLWERIRATEGDRVSGLVHTGQLPHDETYGMRKLLNLR